jgi:phosphoglycolate phosphatase
MSAYAVLLDLDGTLTDSRPGILASYHAAIRALGHEPKLDLDLTPVIGPPLDEIMGHVLEAYGDDRVAEAITAYRQHYGVSGLFENSVYDGIPQALDSLIAAGFVLCVATSKRTVFARRILDHFGLSGRFRGIYGSEPGGAVDHKAELIANLLQREDIAGDRAVMVGDRRYDIVGAHANRLRAIGVLWGYGSRQELEEAGADQLAASRADLLPAICAQLRIS